MGYCIRYTACMGIGVWQMTFAVNGNSSTPAVFRAKLNWSHEESVFYNAIINSVGIVGIALGSILGGFLIRNGRRRTMLISQLFAILASSIAMYLSLYTLCASKVLLGMSAGIMNVAFPKMIIETIPQHLAPKFALAHRMSITIGYVPLFSMAALLPDADDVEANRADEMWRVIWLAPGIVGLFVILLIVKAYRLEPVTFCLVKGLE